MNHYEQRQESRRERYRSRAAKAAAESAAASKRSHDMMSIIPAGQPVHGARDRNYRERAWNLLGKSVQAQEKAEHYRQKAASVGIAGISSDDPNAVTKLRLQLAALEERHERDRRVNALVRRKDVAGLLALGLSAETSDKLLHEPDYMGRLGIPGYVFSNRSANMRRIRQRIEYLERMAARPEAAPVEGSVDPAAGASLTTAKEPGECPPPGNNTNASLTPGLAGVVSGLTFTITDDAAENRVTITFSGKPPADVRTKLKHAGFRWSPTRGAWVRMRSAWALDEAKRVMGVAA